MELVEFTEILYLKIYGHLKNKQLEKIFIFVKIMISKLLKLEKRSRERLCFEKMMGRTEK